MKSKSPLEQYPHKYTPLEEVTDIRDVDIAALDKVSTQIKKDIQIIEAIIILQNHQISTHSKEIYQEIKSKTQALSHLIYNKEHQFPTYHFTLTERLQYLQQAIYHLKRIQDLPRNY